MANHVYHVYSYVPQLERFAISISTLRTVDEGEAVRQTVNELAVFVGKTSPKDAVKMQAGKKYGIHGMEAMLITTMAGTFHIVSKHEGIAAICFVRHQMALAANQAPEQQKGEQPT